MKPAELEAKKKEKWQELTINLPPTLQQPEAFTKFLTDKFKDRKTKRDTFLLQEFPEDEDVVNKNLKGWDKYWNKCKECNSDLDKYLYAPTDVASLTNERSYWYFADFISKEYRTKVDILKKYQELL